MQAVITGDIINSREVDSTVWIETLRELLQGYGNEPKDWEIYRGDSFQILVDAAKALELCLLIKASIKMNKLLDVRLSIGLGEVSYQSKKITESNGSAFIYSGDQFQRLKKNTLAIKSSDENFDEVFNVLFQVLMFIADGWSASSSRIVKLALSDRSLNQQQLAQALAIKSQSTISAGLKRAAFDEVISVIDLYKSKLKKV